MRDLLTAHGQEGVDLGTYARWGHCGRVWRQLLLRTAAAAHLEVGCQLKAR
jgi:hypothetical protein